MVSFRMSPEARRFALSKKIRGAIILLCLLPLLTDCRSPREEGPEPSSFEETPDAAEEGAGAAGETEPAAGEGPDPCSTVPEGMACIPAGPFGMGENGRDDSLPEHEVFVDSFSQVLMQGRYQKRQHALPSNNHSMGYGVGLRV